MAVYPNPAAGDLIAVDFSLLQNTELRVFITDLAGRIVETLLPGEIPAGDQHMEIDLPKLQAGIYFLSVQDAQGGMLTKRLVKM